MSRKEDFKQKAIEYNNNVNMHLDFYNGAEYGYQYAIDKLCTWLKQHSFDYLIRDMYDNWTYDDDTMIKDIRKEME